MTRRSALATALVLAWGAVGCSRPDAAREASDAGPAFDAMTMAFLSEARALHHEANVQEDAGDYAGAIATITRLVQAPHRVPPAPEVEEVLADGYARLAELDLRVGDTSSASSAVALGLSHAPAVTYFRGHLLEVQGIVEEARAASLTDAGQTSEAARARQRAMKLLEEAVSVQQRVIDEALDGSVGDGGGR